MNATAKDPCSHLMRSPTSEVQKAPPISPKFIRATDLNEVRRLSMTKFLIFVPVRGEDSISQLQSASGDPLPEDSLSIDILQALRDVGTPSQLNHCNDDVVVGDVTVNFSTMEADRRGEPLPLTALEFKTLRYLVENPRRVISRDELLNQVWGYNSYPSTRTVDNQVAKLRKKLELNPANPVHLRTVYGAGYKFLP